jgi:hypothetical protein
MESSAPIVAAPPDSHPLPPISVPILDELPSEADFITNYLQRGRPVILKRATSNWPAANLWSLQYLKKAAGQNVVHVRKNVHLEDYKVGKKYNIEQMTFANCPLSRSRRAYVGT